jgi:hypothetical protein
MNYKKIIGFKSACKALKCSAKLPNFSSAPKEHRKALLAHYLLVIIIDAINGGKRFNWNDWNEPKWRLWWDMEKTATNRSGFAVGGVTDADTTTYVGSRLSFVDKARARYAAKKFYELFRDYYKEFPQ